MTKNGAEKALILKAIDVKRHITKVKEKVEKVRVVKSTKKTLAKPSISIESKDDILNSLFCSALITAVIHLKLSRKSQVKIKSSIYWIGDGIKAKKTAIVISKKFQRKKDLNHEFRII